MATIVTTMQALGVTSEECNACGRSFRRAETMHAVVSKSGQPLGWYCGLCIDDWAAASEEGQGDKR